MSNLVLIVEDILDIRDNPYHKSIDEFSRGDNLILSKYLVSEYEGNSLIREYSQYPELTGQKKYILSMVKNWKKAKKKIPLFQTKLREIVESPFYNELGMICSRENLNQLSQIIPKMLEIEGMFMECVVAYSKEISDDIDANPVDISNSGEGRDEIIRR